jgi:hypothetical protein
MPDAVGLKSSHLSGFRLGCNHLMPVCQNPQDRGENQDERQHAPRVDAFALARFWLGCPELGAFDHLAVFL